MATLILMLISITQSNILTIADDQETSPTLVNDDEQVTSPTSDVVDDEEDASSSEWVAPIGIPYPPFGLNETYRMYDDPDNRNKSLTYYESSSGGYYTHYVDSTNQNATNNNNDYGTKDKPRKSIPSPLAAGSIVEIHNSVSGTSKRYLTINGTKSQPVFIRGVGNPEIEDGYVNKGPYCIWEGLTFHDGGIGVRPHNGSNSHHVCIRNCESYGDGKIGSSAGFGAGGDEGNEYSCIVFYNNHIHHGGDSESTEENDDHGIGIGDYISYVWIINNHIHHMGGDSVQLSHGAHFTAHHIYIGGNTFHDDRENAVDIKQANHVVVSQNEMYGYEPCSSASGVVCVVHYDPCDIFWLFNTMHDARYGIVSTGSFEQYIIGNVIYNITGDLTNKSDHSPHRSGMGIRWYNTGNTYVVNNILYNCITGIGADILSYPTTISNNIICNIDSDKSGYHLTIQGKGVPSSKSFNNIFYQADGSVRIYWSGVYNFLEFQADPNKSIGSLEADPLFIDSENGIFDLQDTSPVLKMEISEESEEIYDRLLELYGIDLRLDIGSRGSNLIDVKNVSSTSSTPKEEAEDSDNDTDSSDQDNSDQSSQEEEINEPVYSGRTDRRISSSSGTQSDFSTKQIFDRYEELYNTNRRNRTDKEYYE